MSTTTAVEATEAPVAATKAPARKAATTKKPAAAKKPTPKVPNPELTDAEREDFAKAEKVVETKATPRKTPASKKVEIDVREEKPLKVRKEFTLTHRENCVLVTIGGNKVKWTTTEGKPFTFTFFDEGCVEGSSTWGSVIIEEMSALGIATKRGGAAVLVSLQKKGLLERGAEHEDNGDSAWHLTKLGAEVALALNEKVW